MALDLGSKRIGVALSDRTWLIASILEVIQHEKFTLSAQRIAHLYQEHKACALVIGLPINMDGTHGPRTQSIQDFARNLTELYPDLPIAFWDERLSTVAAETLLVKADLSRKRRKEVIDKVAATYILQGFLDRLGNI
jgi:putative Holliday junction resolvase